MNANKVSRKDAKRAEQEWPQKGTKGAKTDREWKRVKTNTYRPTADEPAVAQGYGGQAADLRG